MSSTTENKNCLICGSSEFKDVELYRKHGLVKCTNCRFVFCKWIPSAETLQKHYGTYTRNDSISKITISRYHELAATFTQYKTSGNWIDVGCGNGHLLKTVAEDGWNVFGTEFTHEAVEICRSKGIKMQEGPLDVNNYEKGSFDVVTSIEVMEHIQNLHEEVEKFSQLLRKGGILYITTPNFNSLSKLIMKENWSIVEYPEHLCYFTPSTMNRLLSAHGFKKVKISTTGINVSRLSSPASPDEAAISRSKEEKLREAAETNPLASFAKRTANSLLTLTGRGDTLKALYIRI